jgi:hypothetical protein
VRESAADPRVLALLGGVWYSRKPDDVKSRPRAEHISLTGIIAAA